MSLSSSRILLERFKRLKVLVIGDLMLDHFVWGTVSRISPEAPVPVVDVSRETEMPGGAGNVAVNMATLGAEVHVVGLLGKDDAGERLIHLFQRDAIKTEAIVRSEERFTSVKTRIIAHHQQVVRFDREVKGTPDEALQARLWSQIERLLPHMNAIVFSDYAKGVLEAALIKKLIPSARRRGIPITVDPKPAHFPLYRRVRCITPNWQEALEGAGLRNAAVEADVETVGESLRRRLDTDAILITRGEKGMSLFEKNKPAHHIPTRAREVFDVTGAGDTVISTLTLALAAGSALKPAAELANYAAGLVVGKLGTANVTAAELLNVLRKPV